MLMNIQNTAPRPTSPHPILNLGFRIFFVGSAIFAIITMTMWAGIFRGIMPFKASINPFYWHAHEMIFGYALAVIAGFLLTAVKTWTNQPMPYGTKLLVVFLPWLVARLLWAMLHAFSNDTILFIAFIFDMLFWGLTSFFVIKAVYNARQKRQIGIVAKLILLAISQIVFYIGVFNQSIVVQKIGLYLAFYLVLAIVFTIGRRVLPFFIEKGVAVDNAGRPNGVVYTQKNSALLDNISLIGLLGFLVVAVLLPSNWTATKWLVLFFSLSIAISNAIRLIYWYHTGIWQKPLLWSLYLAFWGLVMGFLLFGVAPFFGFNQSLSVHLMALFGVGLTTLAMMARVSLGHTGRNIHTPPKLVVPMFVVFGLAILFRVLLPLIDASYYTMYVLVSQVLWIVAFGLFCVGYVKILASERSDGLFG